MKRDWLLWILLGLEVAALAVLIYGVWFHY